MTDGIPSEPKRRPFVLANMAMSADGKIATFPDGFSQFGSEADSANFNRLRGTVDGILCGARTIDRDQATLTPPRDVRGTCYRIAVTGTGSLSPQAPFFQTTGHPILVLTGTAASTERRDDYQRLAVGLHVSSGNRIEWSNALDWLYRKWEIRRLLLEGGGTLNQTLFRSDLVDELHLTVCPYLIGGQQSPTIAEESAFGSLAEASRWRLHQRRRVKNEFFLIYRRCRSSPAEPRSSEPDNPET